MESSSAVLVMISCKSVSICNRCYARWANSNKITISKVGTRLWCPRSKGIASPSGTKLAHKKTIFVLKSFSFQLLLSLVRYHFRLYFVSVLLIVSVNEIISFSVSVSVSVNEYITVANTLEQHFSYCSISACSHSLIPTSYFNLRKKSSHKLKAGLCRKSSPC